MLVTQHFLWPHAYEFHLFGTHVEASRARRAFKEFLVFLLSNKCILSIQVASYVDTAHGTASAHMQQAAAIERDWHQHAHTNDNKLEQVR